MVGLLGPNLMVEGLIPVKPVTIFLVSATNRGYVMKKSPFV
jgi:hypothetical protein